MSAQGVFTRLKRVTFVEKESTDVGSGTAYPMKVNTPDELAEILYRVRQCNFSGGISTFAFGFAFELGFSGSSLPTDFYYHYSDSGSPPVPASELIIERSYADQQAPPTNIDFERGIWTEAKSGPHVGGYPSAPTPFFFAYYYPLVPPTNFPTGFSYFSYCNPGPYWDGSTWQHAVVPYRYPRGAATSYPDGYHAPAFVELAFGSTVAWVDNTGSGNPFDPGNDLYPEMYFQGYTSDGNLVDVGGYSYDETFGANPTTWGVISGGLDLVLSGSTLHCDLYGCVGGAYIWGGTITATATEWFPYAKATGPAWNSATGAKL